MRSTSPIDLSTRGELERLAEIVKSLRRRVGGYDFLLVGAMARDVLLSHAHGVPPERATLDADFAFRINDWKGYEKLRAALLKDKKITEDKSGKQRFRFDGRIQVDFVPFGGVERADRTIAWPPEGDVVLNVLGYREAMSGSILVRLPLGQQVSVVSLAALAVLKVMAWNDRHYREPLKDASDLWMIFRNYLEVGNRDRLFEEAKFLLEEPGFDLDRSGAWLLGHDARTVLLAGDDPEDSFAILETVLRPQISVDGPLLLAVEMWRPQPEIALNLLSAFHAGLMGIDRLP